MLKKENRLSSNFEFNVARKYGNHVEGDLTHVYFVTPTNYTGPTKVGIVISNKFHKNAVVRNRTKRLFREVIQKNFDKIDKGNLWIAVHPKFSVLNKTYEEINADFNKILQKASLSN